MGSVRMNRSRPRGPAAAIVAALTVLLFAVPSAQADTTVIGEQSLQSNGPLLNGTGQSIPVFQGDAGAGYVLASPRTGTITSWSFLSGGAMHGTHFELAVLAPADQTGTSWTLVALSAPAAVSTQDGVDQVNGPFTAQIPIDAGDRIALLPTDSGSTPAELGTPAVDGKREFAAPFGGLNTTQAVVSNPDDGQIIPVQATILFTGLPLPPQNTKLPSISGTARQFETLSADEGTWQNGVTKFTDAWQRCLPDGSNCTAIPGATSTAYVPTRDDVGFALRFQVTATNAGGDSPPTQSQPTGPIARGVVTARLSLSPNPTCTGIPTTFDGSASVSPDGIKSYSFSLIDLYAAAEFSAERNGATIDSEGAAQFGDAIEATELAGGGANAQFLISNFDGRPTVTSKPTLTETLDWNRDVNFNINDPLTPDQNALARDTVGVLLIVTDFQGHSAETAAVLNFAQRTSTDSRANCPKLRRILLAPNTALLAVLAFSKSGQPQMRAGCTTPVACVGSITVVVRGRAGHAADSALKRRPAPRLLASGFFSIPPHKRRTVALKLTKLGKHLLRRGARVAVTVTVTSISPTGHAVKHAYAEVLHR